MESKTKEAKQEAADQQAKRAKENKVASKPKKSREFTSETYSPSIYDPPIPFPILSNKRKLEDHEMVMLTKDSSAILQKKLPPKLKNPRSFTIPYTIGNSYIDKALRNLGASINLMPLSVFKKLGLGEAKPTTISLQLADKSIEYPRGLIQDILVKVDKFIFPTNFIVLDMGEDEEIPLILGRGEP
ncbi:hypothetical protein F2P56_003656 [Juglans regia]|uniref:Uncharacterized protein n=2 Tax=Juglans regia TaxID=51240 RepID=A0A833XT03_JUGRE|nr:uncharacterized protein LOC108999131 [Juglans regia]KAF5476972.1 hypothetical protein F2P56_003656 [Juglans regia]